MKRILIFALVLVILSFAFITAFTVYGTGNVAVYGDKYMTKYFQRDKIMDINIIIGEEELKYMLDNAASEEYVIADLTVNGDTYSAVKIRPKGNSSLTSVVQSDSDRYSFKIEFGSYIKGQTMAGITQLNLNNNYSDPSYMREFISYTILEKMGVAVPAFAYAKVSINGEYFGLYTAVESILEPFLENTFGSFNGSLYKAVSGSGDSLTYKGDSAENYPGLDPKTENADWEKLGKMLDALNNGGDIEKYLDVDATLRYFAVNTALLNMDSYQGNFAHNYYLYELNGKFTLIPWDYNMSFGGFNMGGGGQGSSIYIDEPTTGTLSDRPLIAKLLENEEYKELYHKYLEETVNNYLSDEYIQNITSDLFALISDLVKEDPTNFFSYQQFEQNALSAEGTDTGTGTQANQNQRGMAGTMGGNSKTILEVAREMSSSILKQLSGEEPSTNEGKGSGQGGMGGGPGDFGDGNMPSRWQDKDNGNNDQRQPPQGGFDGVQDPGGDTGQTPGGMQDQGQMQGGFGGGNMPNMDSMRQIMEMITASNGTITDEIKEKALELGISEEELQRFANMGQGQMPGSNDRGGQGRPGMSNKNDKNSDVPIKTALTTSDIIAYVSCAAVIAAAVILLIFIPRRRYV